MEFGKHTRVQQQVKLVDPKFHFMSSTKYIKYEQCQQQ